MISTSHILGRLKAIGVFGTVALLAGCAGLQEPDNRVTGTVVYRERISLSPDENTLTVRLLDVSRADGPADVISEIRNPAGNSPMVFILPYQAAEIDPRDSYAVEARITDLDGNLIFRSDRKHAVITRDAPTDVEILVRRVSQTMSDAVRQANGSDISRDVGAIEARLPDLRLIPGQYTSDENHAVSYRAYVTTDEEPVYVELHRDLGRYGKSDIKFYYRNGKLLRFVEDATRTNYGGTDEAPLKYSLTLDFAMGRFATGTKTVNGMAATPDEHEVSGALAQSQVVLSRLEADLSVASTVAVNGPQTFVCEDKSSFYARFDPKGEQATVEFLGREPIVLRQQATGSGYGYANEMYELRGKGDEAVWRAPGGAVKCVVSADIGGLKLAPGDFPVVTVTELEKPGNDDWTRDFSDLQPGITACLAQTPGDLAAVLTAWPMNHGMVGVRTVNGNGARYDCLAPSTGLGEVHTEMVETATNILDGEGVVRFTPSSGAYPEGECFTHQRLEQNGVFIGWLSRNRCSN